MKPKFILLVIAATSLTFVAHAQDIDFDLKNYKTTDYERSSLNLDFDLGETYSSYNLGYNYSDNIYDNSRTSTTGRANFNLGIEYDKIIQNTYKIVNSGSSLSIKDSYQMSEYQSFKEDTTFRLSRKFGGDYNLYGFYNQDYYYSGNSKSYFLLGGSTSLNLGHNKDKLEENGVSSDDIYQQFYSSVSASVSLGHGHGRVEQVEDAVEALYILHELNANGQLKRAITENDVKLLADKITSLKKERFFDSRLQRQKTMKTLIELLSDNGNIKLENIDIYNTIADYHYFAGIQTRSSGSKFSYYLTPKVYFYNQKYSDGDYYNEFEKAIGGNVSYKNYKPVSVRWQRNFSGTVSFERRWMNDVDYDNAVDHKTESESTSNILYSSVSYAIGFYPSTRSYLEAKGYVYYTLSSANASNPTSTSDSDSDRLNTGVNITGYYYLSERLRLSGIFWVRGNNRNSKLVSEDYSSNSLSDYFDQSFSMSLQYFLF